MLLKPRHRPGEGTFHVAQDHPEAVLARLGDLPANLEVTYEAITSLLPATDLLLTVSSTAGLEAVAAGVRTVFLSDLGIHEKHGNQVLLPSGLLASFDDVIADRLPRPAPDWLADLFVGGERTPAARVVDRVVELTRLPPDRRPAQLLARSAYLSGRVAIRRRREQLPPIARDPAGSAGAAGRTLVSVLMPVLGRAELLLRALLPASWYRAALGAWRRVRVA